MKQKVILFGLLMVFFITCRSQALQVNVHFDSLYGLAPGDRVLFESNAAGRVDSIHYNKDGSYDVRLLIDTGFTDAATEYTRFTVVDDASHSGHKAVAMVLSRKDGQPLTDGALVKGDESGNLLSGRFHHGLDVWFATLKEQLEQFADDVKQVPESKAYKQLERSLSDLAEEIGRSEAQARRKLKEEWLPLIEKELEQLKRRLKEQGREDEAAPLQEELERIRRI
jgi:preprotein translocase subunit YajC